MLLGTAVNGGAALVESSPHDYFWGCGVDGSGANHLGALLMRLRAELAAADSAEGHLAALEGRGEALGRASTPLPTR